VEVQPGETVEEVLRGLGVPPEKTRIVLVDNRPAELSQPLAGGERVGIFPAIGGG
jgi:sulfur carrier protein ThiS